MTEPSTPLLPSQPVIRHPSFGFMAAHPARWMALGFGAGLSPLAPGTVGTLWAWLAFSVLQPLLSAPQVAWLLIVSGGMGWWACTLTARHMNNADPGAIVWDEILAFWLMLWLLLPASFKIQVIAFALFRYFDAAKPGPVAWADQRFKSHPGQPIGWAQGFGILFDDLVAAFCALLVISLWLRLWPAG